MAELRIPSTCAHSGQHKVIYRFEKKTAMNINGKNDSYHMRSQTSFPGEREVNAFSPTDSTKSKVTPRKTVTTDLCAAVLTVGLTCSEQPSQITNRNRGISKPMEFGR